MLSDDRSIFARLSDPRENGSDPEVPDEVHIGMLRYPGGKTRAIKTLVPILQAEYPTQRTLLSPFLGGGSIELHMHGLGYTVHANDLFGPLATFWRMVLEQPEELKTRIRTKMPVTKEAFDGYRQTIMTLTDPLEIAATYFVVNRCSFSGSTFCGGFSREAAEKRMTESSVERIPVSLDRMTIECKDAVEFLTLHPETRDTVVYADPPYAITNYVYGKDGDLHQAFDHTEFANALKQRSDWVLSYNDCPLIRELYKDCRIVPVAWAYGMNRSKKSSEVVILPPRQLQG